MFPGLVFWAIKLILAILLGAEMYLLTISLVLFPHPSTAFAAQVKPTTDWSFYITTSDINTIKTLGCNQGHFDAGFSSPINSLVVLDFGVQNSTGTGMTMVFGHGTLTNSQVENLTYWFSEEYYRCTETDTTSQLYLGEGANDSNPAYSDSTYNTLGKDWAQVVQAVQSLDASYVSQVHVWGANDLEAWHYSTGQVTSDQGTAWVNGYSSIFPAAYVNYGDAIGCPTSYTSGKGAACSYGYYQYDYWYYSWGAPPARVTPEIYTTSPNNSGQWTNISLYATHYQNGMAFEGPWDENDLNSSTLTASQAWTDFSNALSAAGVNSYMPRSLEIHCEQSGQCGNG